MTYEAQEQPATLETAMAKHGVTITAVFVPWSQSRNKAEKQPSLNWKVTLTHNGREVITTDYMAGRAHCPSYKQGRETVSQAQVVRWECENGKPGLRRADFNHVFAKPGGKPIEPKPADVLHSLLLDAGVMDYASFENWAGDLGYDPDSRKAEVIYRACLDIALKLQAGLGVETFRDLLANSHDY